jgi:hypothetical protein
MSLVRDAIMSVAKEGEITHEFTVKGLKIVLRALKTEEQLLADGMVDSQSLKGKYGAGEIMTLSDTITKYRSIGRVALAVKTVNGQSPVDTNAALSKQFEQRKEFRDELMEMGSGAVDIMIREYNKLADKEQEFYKDIDENLGK